MCLGSIAFFSRLSRAVIFGGGQLERNFDSIMKGNLLLVRQVLGTIIVVTVGVMRTAEFKHQEGRRLGVSVMQTAHLQPVRYERGQRYVLLWPSHFFIS